MENAQQSPPEALEITVPWFGVRSIFFIILTIPILICNYYLFTIIDKEPFIVILFLIGCFMMYYGALGMSLNKTTIRLDRQKLSLQTGPFPGFVWDNHTFETATIARLEIVSYVQWYKFIIPISQYDLVAIFKNGGQFALLEKLAKKSGVKAVLPQINEALEQYSSIESQQSLNSTELWDNTYPQDIEHQESESEHPPQDIEHQEPESQLPPKVVTGPSEDPVTTKYRGYYPEFELRPEGISIPDSLKQLLWDCWQKTYPELYETDEDEGALLDDIFELIIDELWPEGDPRGHSRCVWMLRIMGMGARSILANFLPSYKEPDEALALAADWPDSPLADPAAKAIEIFPDKIFGAQEINEARSVLYHMLLAQNPADTKEALMDALDDCFQGYAIIPGGDGKRDLFNWWLVEVIPAAWNEQLPPQIYSIKLPWPPK